MDFLLNDKPIIACSTGLNSNTAIAVIRLSGFENLLSLQKFFDYDLKKIKPRLAQLLNIKFENKIYDNVVFTFFPEGKSYTGENVIELSVHGNQINVKTIIDLFLNHSDFVEAHPGEFTYRALKNKKLSLSQVEGLDLLLNANSPFAISQGLEILQGDLHSQYLILFDHFLKMKAAVEILIDFSDDVGDQESKKIFSDAFYGFYKLLSTLEARTRMNSQSLLTPEIVLCGQANAGKSSLFNLFLNFNRSIVSPIAGTTRDYLSEQITLSNVNFRLIDTAGIRNSSDQIEQIGVNRAIEIISRAFFKILIINPFEINLSELNRFNEYDFDILIFSHSDSENFKNQCMKFDFSGLKTKAIFSSDFITGSIGPVDFELGPMGPKIISSGSIGPEFVKSGPMGPQNGSGSIGPFLENFILSKFHEESAKLPILLDRHRGLIAMAYQVASRLSNDFNKIDDLAVLSFEVNLLGNHISELIGQVSPDQVLNSIFSNFCIGK